MLTAGTKWVYVRAGLKVLVQHVSSILALRHLLNYLLALISPLFRELQGLLQGLVSLVELLGVSLLLHHLLRIGLRLVLKDSVDPSWRSQSDL